ncbi:MAG: hypothetical protein GF334_05485 [Candidatus Altiarchaeales archaeon]|nr:hypothetical protein [Candidatus Altiarchaeales archaeon]
MWADDYEEDLIDACMECGSERGIDVLTLHRLVPELGEVKFPVLCFSCYFSHLDVIALGNDFIQNVTLLLRLRSVAKREREFRRIPKEFASMLQEQCLFCSTYLGDLQGAGILPRLGYSELVQERVRELFSGAQEATGGRWRIPKLMRHRPPVCERCVKQFEHTFIDKLEIEELPLYISYVWTLSSSKRRYSRRLQEIQ